MIEEWSDFIATALSCGSAAIVSATPSHNEAIYSRLTASGLDLRAAVDQGRYQAFDAGQMLSRILVDGRIDEMHLKVVVTEALARAAAGALDEDGRVVILGEMVGLLWADGRIEAAIELERLCNVMVRSYGFTLRCAYPAATISGERGGVNFRRLCAEHSVVVLD
jgi:hypothetical protein